MSGIKLQIVTTKAYHADLFGPYAVKTFGPFTTIEQGMAWLEGHVVLDKDEQFTVQMFMDVGDPDCPGHHGGEMTVADVDVIRGTLDNPDVNKAVKNLNEFEREFDQKRFGPVLEKIGSAVVAEVVRRIESGMFADQVSFDKFLSDCDKEIATFSPENQERSKVDVAKFKEAFEVFQRKSATLQ